MARSEAGPLFSETLCEQPGQGKTQVAKRINCPGAQHCVRKAILCRAPANEPEPEVSTCAGSDPEPLLGGDGRAQAEGMAQSSPRPPALAGEILVEGFSLG